MAVHYTAIQKALETHLASTSGLPDVAWENVSFEPTTGVPFVIPLIMFEGRTPASRGKNPQQRYEGTYRLELLYPEGEGPGNASAMADAILSQFDATTDIITPDITIRVDESYRGEGVLRNSWYAIPISIIWYTYKV